MGENWECSSKPLQYIQTSSSQDLKLRSFTRIVLKEKEETENVSTA